MRTLAVWLDLILLVLLVLFVFFGFKRGLAKTLTEFVGAIAAAVAAILLASFFANLIFDAFVRGSLEGSISGVINESAGASAADKLQAVLDALPGFVSNSLASYGLGSEQLSSALSGTADAAAGAGVELIKPIVTSLIQMILVFVLFVLLMIVVKIVARGVDTVFRLPLLHQLNSLLGGIFGILRCAVFVLLACAILRAMIPMLQPVPPLITEETIGQTFLFRHVYSFNPLSYLMEIL